MQDDAPVLIDKHLLAAPRRLVDVLLVVVLENASVPGEGVGDRLLLRCRHFERGQLRHSRSERRIVRKCPQLLEAAIFGRVDLEKRA